MRLGIFGGTFDPPHNGHVHAAKAFLREAELDALYIMPAASSSHKRMKEGSDPQVRLALAHAAFDGIDPRITVSDYEIDTAGVSYTYKTLSHFAEMPDTELFFLCGTDMFLSMGTWLHPEIIFASATVVCAMRENDPAAQRALTERAFAYKTQYGARTMRIFAAPVELSSSGIRQILKEGGDASASLPERVVSLIDQYSLYRSDCHESDR